MRCGRHRGGQAHLLSGTSAKDLSSELLAAFLERPRSGALVDREDELGDGAQDLEELGFGGFHARSSPENALAVTACLNEAPC